jgi:hypothetical protein
MLKKASSKTEANCLKDNFNKDLLVMSKRLKMSTAAKSIREAVRKKGGEYCRASFPREKTLDQAAYIKETKNTDMGLFLHLRGYKDSKKSGI